MKTSILYIKKLYFLAFLVVYSSILLGQSIYKGTPFIKTMGISNYNASPINRAIAQDENGIIYFGNGHGLLQFDGGKWETFSVKSGFMVLSILIEKERIYVGSQFEFGYFQKEIDGHLQYHSLSDSLENEYKFTEVFKIFEIDNSIYFFSYEYVFVLTDGKINAIKIADEGFGGAIINEGIAVSNGEKGLVKLNKDGIEVINSDDQLKLLTIKSIIPTSKNRMLIFSKGKGIFELENGLVKKWQLKGTLAEDEFQISSVLKTTDSNFIIGTFDSGIFKVDAQGEIIEIFNKRNGLKSNTVNDLFQDKNKDLWAVHNNGISLINYKSPFTKIDENSNVQGFGNVAARYQKELFLGSSTGLYKYDPVTNAYQIIPNSDGEVLSLEQYGKHLLVGHSEGVFLYQDQKLKKISDWVGAWKITKVPNYKNKLIIGGYRGLEILNLSGDDQFQSISLIDFKEPCRVMEFDEEGYLWVTHGLKGIFRVQIDFEKDTIEEVVFYYDIEVFPSNLFINVFKIDNDVIFTGDKGVFQFNHTTQQFEPSEKFQKLFSPDLRIRELEEDHLGNIYYYAYYKSGIIKNPWQDQQEKIEEPFFQIMHLVDNGIVDFTFVDEQNLFLGANEGFIHFNPNNFNYSKDSFRLFIRTIEVTNNSDTVIYQSDYGINVEKEIRLPFSKNALRFSCSATFFSNIEQIQYSYFIENFDQSWSPWSSISQKEYINLPPGNYTFKVKSKNIFQIESNIDSIDFTILPPWYKTKLAYFIYFILTLSLLRFWYLRFQKKYTQEKEMLQQESQKEIDERENQIAAISRSKKEEVIKLKNEKLKAEIDFKNKELASSTLHLINKNQLLSEIKQGLQKAQELEPSEKLPKTIDGLIDKINVSIEQDSDWEKFQIHFDHVHGDFSRRLREKHQNLSPQDLKIAAYLRMNLSSKEIAQLLNISLRGVEKARYRLRKKMELDRSINLTQYILQL